VAAIGGVLSVGVLAGVVVGVVLSLGWLIFVATRPPMPLLGRQAGTQIFRDLDENPADETFLGITVLSRTRSRSRRSRGNAPASTAPSREHSSSRARRGRANPQGASRGHQMSTLLGRVAGKGAAGRRALRGPGAAPRTARRRTAKSTAGSIS